MESIPFSWHHFFQWKALLLVEAISFVKTAPFIEAVLFSRRHSF